MGNVTKSDPHPLDLMADQVKLIGCQVCIGKYDAANILITDCIIQYGLIII